MLSLVCIARQVFFFSWESACDQHRANQDRAEIKLLLQALTSAQLKSQDCSNF
ncbi:unnamed protein product [Staurois parvus]|uniref:Uncharacterized protein n=1 Tax=Staurois parvus TaxID=386267 RepID=A0ABN9CGL6_9NEOB|nr:unnamed protein product [Staurois parvus]